MEEETGPTSDLDANPSRLNLDSLVPPANPQAFGVETLRVRDQSDPDDPGPHFRMNPLRPETLLRVIG